MSKVVWHPEDAPGNIYALVWQIHFDDRSMRNCHPEWQPFNNGGYKLDGSGLGDHWFENSVIRKLHAEARPAWEAADYVGVISHKVTEKTGVTPAHVAALMDQHPDLDCYWIGEPFVYYNHFELACHFHPQLAQLYPPVFEHLGWGAFDPKVKYLSCYCNYWLTRPALFDRYVSEVLAPTMDLLDSNEHLRKLGFKNANYVTANAPRSVLRSISGYPWYTAHTFLVERLFGYWATREGLTAGRVNHIVREHGKHPRRQTELVNHGKLTFA